METKYSFSDRLYPLPVPRRSRALKSVAILCTTSTSSSSFVEKCLRRVAWEISSAAAVRRNEKSVMP